ncbi:hypothetical protein [Aeromonas phage AS-yj]|uniref:Uncharacterized protein n=4 Tax=Caudoviricetes TaxID=2731619 RepID=A0A223LDE1_9CAUD|nr:hypothetical protein HWB28_gp305 [Aeromonas phage AS-zj]YP_009834838.1 hypothetical protein HWB29_gp136 [Aeromonas phage AS-sw]ATI17748.1 hypothetical protein [Aeromonas phage AS-yj]QAX99154.1 hypothetical protein assk_372 [Aeromonas phage Assk]UKM62825.1 hypothetical protein P19_0337 [Aeromonas phage P19]ASU00247.1 hypothetical protein [Aeromonas phage AS-zj]ATI18186.1 hypothetical protein [Aeromonas phage AS-sw]
MRYQPYDEDEGPRLMDTHDRYGNKRDIPEEMYHPESMMTTPTGWFIKILGLGIVLFLIFNMVK